jgi:prepilin peptidase CpaA
MLELLALAAFAGLLIYAACSDIASLTIPNWVSIALACIFPVAALAAGLPLGELGVHLLFGFAMLTVGFFLFQAKVIGGGDAKLLAAVAIWTGFSPALYVFFFWTTFAGGIMALALVAARQLLPRAATYPAFVSHLLQKQNGIPYGVAIMVGGLMAIPALSIIPHTLTLP